MKIEQNKILKELTTFKIGGSARFFCSVKSEEDLLEALAFAAKERVPFFIFGGGSNILVSDAGFDGLVIKMEINDVKFSESSVIVGAGENWDSLVEQCVSHGLYGLENLSSIPGTVGAAPVQNIGAYGSEVKDTIKSVKVYDTKEQKFSDFSKEECRFEYRDSIFKKEKGRFIITSVVFNLKREGKINIEYKDLKEYFKDKKEITQADVRKAVIEIRSHKFPDLKKVGTAGSFFKNPIVLSVKAKELQAQYPQIPAYPVDNQWTKLSLAWILDKICGYKGVTKGNVGTYQNQALVIVNNGSATAKEVKDFAGGIKQTVKEKTGITIEEEVQRV